MSISTIKKKYLTIKQELPTDVQLVAVSKTHPVEEIKEVYDLGQRVFGENKVQELVEKHPLLPNDIQWHLIGHLQTNKVKYIAGFIDTIQSVDSEKLLKEINKQAKKHQRKIKILLQIKIAEETAKTGLDQREAEKLFEETLNEIYPNIEIVGLMGMATFTEDKTQLQREFGYLKKIYDEFSKKKPLSLLSMGMSSDYPIAIQCGANSVRIGTAIFGHRDYPL